MEFLTNNRQKEMIDDPFKSKFEEVCIGCGLEGTEYVECKGIHYCANPICTAVGSTQHKSKAPGMYRKKDNSGYIIKDMDFFWDWCQEQYKKETDPNIKAAMERTLPIWEKKYTDWEEEHGERAKMQHLIDVIDS